MSQVLSQLQLEAIHLLDESMKKIQHCVGQLDERQIWFRPAAELNSIGNLLLHLSGNLRQWVVAGVGGEQDARERAAEFAADEGTATKTELLRGVEQTMADAVTAIESLDAEQSLQQRTIQGFDVTALGAIMHSVPHFVGHTHQIIYITRLQLGDRYQFQWSPDADRSGVPI